MERLTVDVDFLRRFERGLDPAHPERSQVPARVLGYGEISTVFEIDTDDLRHLALKRLPIFRTESEMESFTATYDEYNRLLEEDVGLNLPAFGHVAFVTEHGSTTPLSRDAAAAPRRRGRPVFYILQRQVPYASIGNRAMHVLPREGTLLLVRLVLQELRRVWEYNRSQNRVQVALDGQISNWSLDGFDPQQPSVDGKTRLYYLDTSTPLFRVCGVEQLNPELFLRSAPSFLAWVLRRFFLADVVNRYYDLRRVVMDLLANFYKEQQDALVPDVLAVANEFFCTDVPEWGIAPLTEPELRSYYREDAFIWSFYLAARKIDRFLSTRLLRREYPYILPPAIKR